MKTIANLTDHAIEAAIDRATDWIKHWEAQPRSIFVAGQIASYREYRRNLDHELIRRLGVGYWEEVPQHVLMDDYYGSEI